MMKNAFASLNSIFDWTFNSQTRVAWAQAVCNCLT